MNCGERIKTARQNAGLTQKQLGEACGIAEPTIRRYELGKLNPKFETLERIAGALNTSAALLLGLNTVDAVEVVRCGNCKHFCEPFCVRRDDETHRERINMLTVDFCSYGERKDNEKRN